MAQYAHFGVLEPSDRSWNRFRGVRGPWGGHIKCYILLQKYFKIISKLWCNREASTPAEPRLYFRSLKGLGSGRKSGRVAPRVSWRYPEIFSPLALEETTGLSQSPEQQLERAPLRHDVGYIWCYMSSEIQNLKTLIELWFLFLPWGDFWMDAFLSIR